MYQIGEFSRICETTIKTLRYYDKIDLLKPASVDYYSGYRYYSDEQIKKLLEIKELQKVGFTLVEIKDILENNNTGLLNQKLIDLKTEFNDKIDILVKKINMEKEKVELIEPKKIYYIGVYKVLSSREELKRIRKIYNNNPLFNKTEDVFITYEKGYKENNIKCFIGKVFNEETYDIINSIKEKPILFDLTNNGKVKNMLHIKTSNIENGYKAIIKYASENNIQIRGEFIEIRNNEEADIYVEAYDLNKKYEVSDEYNKIKINSLKDIHEDKYVGTWYLQGEIIEPSRFVKYDEEHFIPDTKYKTLELHKDGTTNFSNITWKENYLIIEEDNTKFINYIYEPKEYNNETYMEILLNQKESNSRPYNYYYKKI